MVTVHLSLTALWEYGCYGVEVVGTVVSEVVVDDVWSVEGDVEDVGA